MIEGTYLPLCDVVDTPIVSFIRVRSYFQPAGSCMDTPTQIDVHTTLTAQHVVDGGPALVKHWLDVSFIAEKPVK